MSRQDELLKLVIKAKSVNEKRTEDINKAVAAGKALENVLLDFKVVEPEELVGFKAKIIGLPYENLAEKKISETTLNVIPIEVSENYKIICFFKDQRKIDVGIVDLDNFKATEAVNFLAKKENLRANFYLISEASFYTALKQYKSLTEEISSALQRRAEEETEELGKTKKEEEERSDEVIKSAPVAKIVNVIIRHAVDGHASDIHIEPLQKETRVRYRIDGILQTSLVLPKDIHSAIVSRIKVMANLKLDETRLPQDGRLRLTISGRNIDFRVSIIPLVGEEKVVMRILDVSRGAPGLEELGFLGPSLAIIQENIQKTEGMLLVTGPTGSGKSTTLFSIINQLNKEGVNISTLEDPVEYFVQGVNQSQIRPEIGFNFASGLRSLLRQDPNVIMVGEIRDDETAELAVHSGLTGHFVLSTLHTNDAIGAIPRLIDMKVEPFLLASTLNTVIAQRLVRKICEHCKKEIVLPEEMKESIRTEIKEIPEKTIKAVIPDFDFEKIKFYKGAGCSHCANLGYSGRICVAEVVDVNDKLKDMIVERKNIKLNDILENQNFLTIKQDGIIKVLLGMTTYEEILRVMSD